MNRRILSERISSIIDDAQRMTNTLYALNTTDIQRYPDNYEVLSTDAVHRAEKLVYRLRRLVFTTTRIKKAEYLVSAAAIQGINIRFKDGVFEVVLPCLLPNRKQWQSAEYLLEPLDAALADYARGHQLPFFRHCVVAVTYVYDSVFPERRVRDTDNLELKQVKDVIGSYVLEDDTATLVHTHLFAELGTTDLTRISIMENARFLAWLPEHLALS